MAKHAMQLFEYLLALKNMTTPPKREIRLFEGHWFLDTLPAGEGIVTDRDQLEDDVFLTVHKQIIPDPPEPDSILHDWIVTLPDDSIEELTVKESLSVELEESNSLLEDETQIHFEDDEVRIQALSFYKDAWVEWDKTTSTARKIQQFYSELFSLWQRLDREGSALEVMVGHGLLLWKSSEGKIERPLLTTRLSMEFKAEKGVFLFRLSDQGTRLETEMLAGIDVPNAALLEERKRKVRDEGIDLFDPEQTRLLFEEFVTLLDSDGVVRTLDDPYRPYDFPVVFDRVILFVRKAGEELWKTELATAADLFETNQLDIPVTIQSLFSDEPIRQNAETAKRWEAVGTELFFPLPANEDQREIAKRLSGNFGLTVQGPPGTGKSHTIANLISHLLAHGKRVLITSQTEKALKVLKDKIPKEIQPLCVPVLGGDSKSVKEIQLSVDAISDKLANENPLHLEREVENHRQSLFESKKRIAELHSQLKNTVAKEHQKVVWKGVEIDPIQAAKRLAESEINTSWIKDEPKLSDDFPLTDEEVEQVLLLKETLTPDAFSSYQLSLPPTSSIPTPDIFSQLVQRYQEIKQNATTAQDLLKDLSPIPSSNSLDVLTVAVKGLLEYRDVMDGGYFRLILDDMLIGGDRKSTWEELRIHTEEKSQEILNLQRSLSEHELDLPNHPYDKLREDLLILHEVFQKGKPGFLFNLTKGRHLKYLTEHVTIDGRRLGNVEDVKKLLTYLDLTDKKSRLMRRWNATILEIDGPVLSLEEKRFAVRAGEFSAQIERVQKAAESIRKLQELMKELHIPKKTTIDSSFCEHLLQKIQAVRYHHELKQAEYELQQIRDTLSASAADDRHPIWTQFEQAAQNLNADAWKKLHDELDEIKKSNAESYTLAQLLDKASRKAPQLVEKWKQSIGTQTAFPPDYREAWEIKQLELWLEEVSKSDPGAIERNIREEEARSRRLIEQIVSTSTWKAQLQRVTETQRKSLSAWKTLMGKIGKGTGKYADKHRLAARKEMEKCQGSIPVWIMPINRVIESFALGNDKFDVVIVDESSQCDLFSLSVLLRAEKAVIVGDSEQISPSAVGVDVGDTMQLMNKHLKGVPRSSIYDMKTSLYDLGDQIFPQGARLMLKEHFRCVPEIIQFSNDLSYDGKIIPLRLPTADEKIDPPVLSIRVHGLRDEDRKINEFEAHKIVEDMKKMLNDPIYDNQTFGVISLLGKDQVKYLENLIRREIGEEVMEKRRILCGDAYDFQGDERDIMFLSMVVADNKGYMALTKKEDRQRFNVAASRAKNQMRLYHTVDLDDLKQEDMRHRLLSYCLEPKREPDTFENLEELCDSPFEVEVLRMILARGYKVTPQYKAGGYRIDLVIEGIRNRLAVECDGEAYHDMSRWEYDRERQRVLERVGWTFWRVRGFDFYLNREKAMMGLWEKLEQMGIERASIEQEVLF